MTVDDLFGLAVAYEMYALASGRLPSLTRICRRHPLTIVPLLALAAAHLLRSPE